MQGSDTRSRSRPHPQHSVAAGGASVAGTWLLQASPHPEQCSLSKFANWSQVCPCFGACMASGRSSLLSKDAARPTGLACDWHLWGSQYFAGGGGDWPTALPPFLECSKDRIRELFC